ncbi:MAG TPA: MBL fold metallo-hydrolase [Dehalococcoidia bacterium]|nr:MBL fold metallo-hydrolase [Dehalococcoidia bacterium]
MAATIDLPPVDRVEITTLCENLVDSQVPRAPSVDRLRPDPGRKIESGLFAEARPEPFHAAHGLSMLVRVTRAGITRSVLFDAGGSPDGLVHNLDSLGLSPRDWSCIVLSHGHFDHVLGLVGLQKRLKRLDFPLTLHPDAYLMRGVLDPSGQINSIGAPSRPGLRDAGLELIETDQPSFVLEKMALVTGQVERTNSYEVGWPAHQANRGQGWAPDPLICDDQALVVNVKGRGLVVLSGCGHAGIVNIVSHAQAITGVSKVCAVIGGFHLGGDYFQQRVPEVVRDLVALNPTILAPAHCTGYRAAFAIYQALPDAFVQNTVGTRITLEATAD